MTRVELGPFSPVPLQASSLSLLTADSEPLSSSSDHVDTKLLGRRCVLPNATIDFLMSSSSSGGGASGGGASGGGAPAALCGKEASAVAGDEAPILGTIESHAVWIQDALA